MMNFKTLFAVIATASLALAVPTERASQDVWAPPFTFPTAGVQLAVGKTYKFTWLVVLSLGTDLYWSTCRDASNPPAQITNQVGAILLRKGDVTTSCMCISVSIFQKVDDSIFHFSGAGRKFPYYSRIGRRRDSVGVEWRWLHCRSWVPFSASACSRHWRLFQVFGDSGNYSPVFSITGPSPFTSKWAYRFLPHNLPVVTFQHIISTHGHCHGHC